MIEVVLRTTLETGSAYGIAALGVLMTFAVIEFYDLTVDGSFTLGGAIAALLITAGWHPALVFLPAMVAGAASGAATALLHVRFGVDRLLSGILMMFVLYTVNLRLMGRSNLSLLNAQTIFSLSGLSAWLVLLGFLLVLAGLMFLFLRTEIGTLLRAYARSPRFVASLGVSSWTVVALALVISNALVAMAGSLIAQLQRYTDIGMGEGTLIFSLAAVIIGKAIVPGNTPGRLVAAVAVGSLGYQVLVSLGLRAGLAATDFKLLTAVLIISFISLGALRRRWSAQG
ncbi:MAG: ABC transporter permease [Planctomycetes bacterium]|nr:ABC transporter permease [Planctomycetota bacterium]